jgi:hypothetical protein
VTQSRTICSVTPSIFAASARVAPSRIAGVDLLFPVRSNFDVSIINKPFDSFSRLKAKLDEISGAADWCLQRSAPNGGNRHGSARHRFAAIEKCLNHQSRSFRGISRHTNVTITPKKQAARSRPRARM